MSFPRRCSQLSVQLSRLTAHDLVCSSEHPNVVVAFWFFSWHDGDALWTLVNQVSPNSLLESERSYVPADDIAHAMQMAENQLGIPQILRPEHMANAADERSIMTYISYFKAKVSNIRARV